MNDESPRFGDALDAMSTTVNLDWTLTLLGQLQLSLRPGYQRFEAAGDENSFTSVGFSAARREPRSAWTSRATGTYTQLQDGSQWRQDISFGYRITPRQQLGVQFRYTSVRGVAEPFTETLGSLRVTRRW